MERLWTPWRLRYVTEASEPHSECIFCDAVARLSDEPLVVHAGAGAFVILNKYPYNNGHLMVVPRRHVAWLADLHPDELSEIMTLTQQSERVLNEAYHPHGFNMGLNLGKPAGAGVLGHLHMHVVPRWNGEINCFSLVGATLVLPEDVYSRSARVRASFQQLQSTT
jgi:ATP adenylyltransferase